MTGFKILAADFENQTVFQANFSWETKVPDGFEEWFTQHGEYISTSEKQITNDINVRQTTLGQCFHNGQLLSIDNDDIDYYEGIMYGPIYKTAIHHGFNTLNNKTIDITYISNIENFHNEDRRDKYYIYYGIKIPKDFILKYSENLKVPNQQHPLIVEYYKSVI